MRKNARWLWVNSATVWQGSGFIVLVHRIRFFFKALWVYSSVRKLIEAPRETPLGKLMEHRPETVGAVIWPYQCAGWNARTRLARICDHYAVVEKMGGVIDFPVDSKISLLDLGEIREGLNVVIDQPRWVMREGQLSINLFLHDVRLYTLAFSLFHNTGNEMAAFIGAIQGRDIEGAVEGYRELTKASHGIHPRNLLVKIFQMFCLELGVMKIFAVSDEYRHHRDQRYFGRAPKEKFHSDYNAIWTERGGSRVDPMFYQLDVGDQERDLTIMSSTKRKKYRRRAEVLQRTHDQMRHNLSRRVLC